MPLFLTLLPLVLMGLYLLLVSIFILEVKILLLVINHPVKEGVYRIDKVSPAFFLFFLNSAANNLIEFLFDKLLIPKGLTGEFLFRLFGAKMGKNVHVGTPIFDPYLVEIGDNSVTGYGSLILGHLIEGNKIIIKKTKIGKNVTIGAYSIISPGVTIEDNVIVAANSFVKKNSVLKKNHLYAGTPARIKKKL